MPVRYNETYEIVTPESAEHGEAEDRGLVDENVEATFHDLVMLLEGTEPSSSLISTEGYLTWYTAPGDPDYRTGAERLLSYHPVDARAARYMARAWRFANGS